VNALETQLYATRGFNSWLSQQPSSDENASLLNVLNTYQAELERQITSTTATPEWFGVLELATIEGSLLRDELREDHPALNGYCATDEPQDIEQMKVRLLTDTVNLFETTCKQLGTYLEKPASVIDITDMVQRVLTHHPPTTFEVV
jgi:hypothetical protein